MAEADLAGDQERRLPLGAPTGPLVPGRLEPPPAPAPAPADDAREMSLVGHLTELRDRLVRVVLAILVGAVLGFVISDEIVRVLTAPIPGDEPLRFTDLGGAFAIKVRIALITGIILAMPVILYQVWAFVAPGLTPAERRTVRPWIPLALLFFAMGVAIAYVILPFAVQFLLGFASADLQPFITVGPYFDFVTTMFLAFGLIMEFPILLVGLSRVGVVTSARLASSRRVALLAIAVFAAGATPGGDLVSPFVLGATMYALFEGTIVAIRRSGR